MKAMEMEAAGINLSLVSWLARHASDVPEILAAVQSVASATSLVDRWTAIKVAGDLLVADLSDFPGLSSSVDPSKPVNPPVPGPVGPIGPLAAVSASEVDAAMQAIGDGHIINAIITLVTNPQFLALLELIFKLFGFSV